MLQQSTVLRSLAWKDFKAIRPLLLAILAGIVLLHVMVIAIQVAYGTHSDSEIYVSLWILMPNLMALGAPAMLIGSEEESGTLGWLRTLPVSWRDIAWSKFLVAAGCVAISWIVATLFLMFAFAGGMRVDPFAKDMLGSFGIAQLVCFTATILLISFSTAYAFRSPVLGLILLLPIMSLVTWFGDWVVSETYSIRYGFRLDRSTDHPSEFWLFYFAAVCVFLGILYVLQRWLARRRLYSPVANIPFAKPIQEVATAYRPPVVIGLRQPSRVAALLWQQSRQSLFPAIGFALVSLAFLIFGIVESRGLVGRGEPTLPALIMVLCSCWLGSLCFYGDSIRRRCAFFADRGISPSQVWWTRLLLPTGFAIVVWLAFGLLHWDWLVWIPISIFAFGVGQLVSMWAKRPVLAFFGSPTLFVILMVFYTVALEHYQPWPWLALGAIVLLLATWALCRRWLNGTMGTAFSVRIIGFVLAAILLPSTIVILNRVSEIPRNDPQWRASMLSKARELPYVKSNIELTSSVMYQGDPGGWDYADRRRFREQLRLELEGNQLLGEHVSFDALACMIILPNSSDEQQTIDARADAIAVLLKWSKVIRQKVADGNGTFKALEYGAEHCEQLAVRGLMENQFRFSADKMRELVAMIPSAELRKQSRRNGLLGEWAKVQWREAYFSGQVEKAESILGPERHKRLLFTSGGGYRTQFMGQSRYVFDGFMGIERLRANRLLDQAVKISLQQLDAGLPNDGSPQALERQQAWQAVGIVVGNHWTRSHEEFIESLISQHSSVAE